MRKKECDMSADNISTLIEVAIDVFERCAFMCVDPPRTDSESAALAEPSWLVIVSFSGARAGGIGMVVSSALARQAAANLYAKEPAEMGDEHAQDAVKELLNIVCGSYLHKVEGDEVDFDLAVPSLRSLTQEDVMRYVDGKPQAALAVEGRPLILFIED